MIPIVKAIAWLLASTGLLWLLVFSARPGPGPATAPLPEAPSDWTADVQGRVHSRGMAPVSAAAPNPLSNTQEGFGPLPSWGFHFELFAKRPAFDPARSVYSTAVAVGDVSSDGRDDIVLATIAGFDPALARVFVFRQNADGSLAAAQAYEYAGLGNGVDVALGDMDNDGALDIVIGHGGGVSVLLQSRGFAPEVHATAQAALYIGLSDLDRDGRLDVVNHSWSSGGSLLYGNGQGGFSRAVAWPTQAWGYNDLAIGDVTGDSRDDVVLVQGQGESRFWVFPGNGEGLSPAVTYELTGTKANPMGVAIGDFNGDGRNDVALSESANVPSALSIFMQQPGGALGPQERRATYDLSTRMVAADLDGDDTTDLAVIHSGWNRVGVYLQHPTGLRTEQLFEVPPYALQWNASIAAGDVNSDGCKDLVFGSENDGLLVYRGVNCFVRRPPVSDPLPPSA